jgi:hypothetical protein
MRYAMKVTAFAALLVSLTSIVVALTAQKPAFEVASIKPKGPMKVYYIVFCVLTLLLMQIAVAQQPSAANVITSPRPLGDAALLRLQEMYGKVVTYEEPLLTWRGELQAMPGRDPEGKWQLFAKPQSFTMPEIRLGTDLGNSFMVSSKKIPRLSPREKVGWWRKSNALHSRLIAAR